MKCTYILNLPITSDGNNLMHIINLDYGGREEETTTLDLDSKCI